MGEVVVRVTPGARRERFSPDGVSVFSIAVKEPAAGNRANDRVRELLALHFGVSVKRIRFLSGARGTTKRFKVVE